MDEWEPNDEMDWLTGQYTHKRARLRKAIKEGIGHDRDGMVQKDFNK